MRSEALSMFDAKLIALVKSHSFLYDKKHALYKNNRAKETAWKAISLAMGRTVGDVSKRWVALRKRFIENRKKLQNESREDAVLQCQQWPLYNTLVFLNDHVPMRMTSSNLRELTKSDLEELTSPLKIACDMNLSCDANHIEDSSNLGEVTKSDLEELTSPLKIECDMDLSCDANHIEDLELSSNSSGSTELMASVGTAITTIGTYFNRNRPNQTHEDPPMLFCRSIATQISTIHPPARRLKLQAQICNLLAEALQEQEETNSK